MEREGRAGRKFVEDKFGEFNIGREGSILNRMISCFIFSVNWDFGLF